ncbi:MAG: LysM peptidoglycan-binding domain-containing protein, partial [Candidatus Sericytochromatia bacterium]|nr:LysM peptidoglycan-binding domain-containing protein [Candidatus Sericytochromatia bacterium]
PLPEHPPLVHAGDTHWDLSGRIYGDSLAWPVLWGWNRSHVRDPHWVFPAQPLFWRLHGTLHVVRPGETLRTIAKAHWGSDRDWGLIWQMNRGWLRRPERLAAGARVWVPDPPAASPRVSGADR